MMKKYLTFFLLILMSIGSVAQTTTKPLTVGEEGDVKGSTWKFREITGIKDELKEFDDLVISFDAAIRGNQYAICSAKETDKDGKYVKLVFNGDYDYFDCEAGQTECTVKITSELLNKIKSGGLRFEYNGLTNIKASIKRLNIDWSNLVPKDAESIGKNLPYKIKDWYAAPYVLQDGSLEAVGKTLRVICGDAGDDAYAFLKNNDASWSSIMSGSDKFSIAGWRYFDIKVNTELQNIIKANWKDGDVQKGGLLIGGNNYTIYGIYLYVDKQEGSADGLDWEEDDNTDLIDTYTFKDAIGGTDGWKEANIPGSFFEYKSETGNQEEGSGVSSTAKLANTKNNIIRLVFDGSAPEGAQVYAKDAEKDSKAAYIRQRNDAKTYVNYADCAAGSGYYDFELSDAITIFADWNKVQTGPEGVKIGMLSKLLLNGMNVGAKGVKIKSVQIRKSLISKYVKGYAELTGHALSASKWCSITFPYNLTHDQLTKAFGTDVRICELGSSKVTKAGDNKGSYHYSILFNFDKIKDDEGVNANYPYLIKLGSAENVKTDNVYPIKDVVADVRDFQAYEFRSGKFDLTALDEEKKDNKVQTVVDKENKIRAALSKDNVCMKFKSTAPVFNISNTSNDSETKVEIINGVADGGFTLLTPPTKEDDDTYYYMRNGALWPVLSQNRRLASGRAYVILPNETKVLFNANGQAGTPNQSKSIIAYSIDDEGGNTTGIDEMEFSAPVVRQAQQNVYSLNGQMIRKGVSTVGLPKGIYIVGGKKLIVK